MQQRTRPFIAYSWIFMTIYAFSCGSSGKRVTTYAMGEGVQVGRLVYNVTEAEWKGEVEGAKQLPKNRFLQLRIQVTNSGNAELPMPMLRIVDAKGSEIGEFAEIEANPQWLGTLRRVQPALTENGLIFFDVPVGAYKLEVVDNSDPENEQTAYVEIPASLAPPPSVGGGGI